MNKKHIIVKLYLFTFCLALFILINGCGGSNNMDSILKTQQGKFEYELLKWMMRYKNLKGDGSINSSKEVDNRKDLISDSLVRYAEKYGKVTNWKCLLDDPAVGIKSSWRVGGLGIISIKQRLRLSDFNLNEEGFNNYFVEYYLTDTSEIKENPNDELSAFISRQVKEGGFNLNEFVGKIKKGDTIQFSGIMIRESSLTRKGRFEIPEFMIHVTSASILSKKN